MRIAIVDGETTGLNPRLHHLWELALGVEHEDGTWDEHLWRWIPELTMLTDSNSLRMNGFYDRTLGMPTGVVHYWESFDVVRTEPAYHTTLPEVARRFATLTDGIPLVAANPRFDASFLERLLVDQGWPPAWHYRLICAETLVAGQLGVVEWPWDANDLSRLIGVDPADYDRHSSPGDVRWARALVDAWRDRAKPPTTTAAAVPTPAEAKKRPSRRDAARAVDAAAEAERPDPVPEPEAAPPNPQPEVEPVKAAEMPAGAGPSPAPAPAAPSVDVEIPKEGRCWQCGALVSDPDQLRRSITEKGHVMCEQHHRGGDLRPEWWPREGEEHHCTAPSCGVDVDLDQARASATLFQQVLCKDHHLEWTSKTGPAMGARA